MGFTLQKAAYHSLKALVSPPDLPHITTFIHFRGINFRAFSERKIHNTLIHNYLYKQQA